MAKWSVEDSLERYNMLGWGSGYFNINKKGNIIVKPNPEGVEIDMKELIDQLQIHDVSTPVLVRFPDILENRLAIISECFKKASAEYDYKAESYIVYPIKVNQMRPVVQELVNKGSKYNIGLEAGSKPELHAVLAFANNEKAPVICNGYKDEEFIELALLAQKMGKEIFIVVEKLSELKLIFKLSNKLKVKPNIGIRIKLNSSGSGKWEESGGDGSKFGLNATELLQAVEIAKAENGLDRIKLIHFHLGSQITNIRKIKTALRESSQFYVELRKLGCDIQFFDIGGGLGIDYDGTNSSNTSSVNYSIQEYVNDAIFTVVDASDKNDLPHPNLIIESGRSLTAHHAMLVFNVLEKTSPPELNRKIDIKEGDHELVIELNGLLDRINKFKQANFLEAWHDAQQIRQEALDLFSLGHFDLPNRAMVETLYWTIARKVSNYSKKLNYIPDELDKLEKMLADKYFCNFSLFQSLPDSWAIDQVFPIVPLHHHTIEPNKKATVQDITCDSDGKIDHFIGDYEIAPYLYVHDFEDIAGAEGQPYYLAVFLVGAYQEILGDLHNLFGDTNAVHVVAKKDEYEIQQVIDGETVADVLEYVQFNPKKLVRTMETWVSNSIKAGKITATEGKEYMAIYRSGLYGYTYLE